MVSPIFFRYIHDVTPSVVPSAVRIEISTCTINFHVSFFIIVIICLIVVFFEVKGELKGS